MDARWRSIPDMHEFTFTADGVVFATQKIMIVQGQRNRFITALMRTGGGGQQKRMVAEKAAPAAPTAQEGRQGGASARGAAGRRSQAGPRHGFALRQRTGT